MIVWILAILVTLGATYVIVKNGGNNYILPWNRESKKDKGSSGNGEQLKDKKIK